MLLNFLAGITKKINLGLAQNLSFRVDFRVARQSQECNVQKLNCYNEMIDQQSQIHTRKHEILTYNIWIVKKEDTKKSVNSND